MPGLTPPARLVTSATVSLAKVFATSSARSGSVDVAVIVTAPVSTSGVADTDRPREAALPVKSRRSATATGTGPVVTRSAVKCTDRGKAGAGACAMVAVAV
jgi:hypothetical protein